MDDRRREQRKRRWYGVIVGSSRAGSKGQDEWPQPMPELMPELMPQFVERLPACRPGEAVRILPPETSPT